MLDKTLVAAAKKTRVAMRKEGEQLRASAAILRALNKAAAKK